MKILDPDLEQIMSEQHNMPLTELPVYDYVKNDLKLFVQTRYRRSYDRGPLGSNISYLNDNMRLDIECLIPVDKTHVAVAYKVKVDDLNPQYVFIIFEKGVYPAGNGEMMWWAKTGERYFISTPLAYEAFSHVKLGDSVESLCSIDPSIEFDLINKEVSVNFINSELNVPGVPADRYMIYKLPTDGVMTFEYGLDNTITEIKYYPYSGNEHSDYISVRSPDLMEYVSKELRLENP